MAQLTLASIRTFEQLVVYLEEELDWPLDGVEDWDDLTFDYDPEEDLGLDSKTAAKIKYIKQLRQLHPKQPFGIFFVEFDRKALPVVAMRRILGKLVSRKRESANPTDRKTWDQDDLLFISAYGEDRQRRMEFAHFADDAENALPTLRVLGWDADETERKREWVDGQLHENLRWPDDINPTEWRIQWRSAFVLRHREVVDTSKKLAHHLATLAQKIRARVLASIRIESEKGHLRKLHRAFQDSLISDLSETGFADMYAQTIAYGLLSAAIGRTVPGEGTALTLDDPGHLATNMSPFLRELMQEFTRVSGRHRSGDTSGIDFDELGVGEVVQLLREANMEAVVRDFGRERPGEDPVIHFYEYFMEVYDKKEKVKRGVFYTPRPVVSFIVRSVDEILREEFGLPMGLADTTTWGEMVERNPDLKLPTRELHSPGQPPRTVPAVENDDPFVQILDPATGTGTFLVEVIILVAARMKEYWAAELGLNAPKDAEARANWTHPKIDKLWNQYVPEHLLPRLYGFELMMAPYAIAHMKIGLKLRDTGYRFGSEQRLRVFLTNSLEPPTDLSEMLEFVAPFLAHEARAATATKHKVLPTVITGNPPYSNFSANLSAEGRRLVARLKLIDGVQLLERNALQLERNINDDYVKFLVWSENLLAQSPFAILGMITNRSYLDARTLRGLRASLLRSFVTARVVDLGGAATSGSQSDLDDNVFDIEQPVGIILLSRTETPTHRADGAEYGRLTGSRDEKCLRLSDLNCRRLPLTLAPSSEQYFLSPYQAADGWSSFLPLDQMLPIYAEGLKTGCDDVLVGFDVADLQQQLSDLCDMSLSPNELRARYQIATKGWGARLLADRVRSSRLIKAAPDAVRFPYRPLDFQCTVYGSNLLKSSSRVAGRYLNDYQPNLAIIAARQVDGPESVTHFLISRMVPDNRIFYSKKGSASYFPVWSERGRSLFSASTRSAFSSAIGLPWNEAQDGDEFAPSALGTIHWLYAIFHSPTYRECFGDALARSFPAVPVPRCGTLYSRIGTLGADLTALHLLENSYKHATWNQSCAKTLSPFATPGTPFHDSGDREVRKAGEKGKQMAPSPDYGKSFGRVYINDTAYFDGVPETVWNFHIGGYQVCHKWLYDRRAIKSRNKPGRILTDDDIAHYYKIVIALNETIRIMAEIDEIIEAHGGWPGAFVTDKACKE